MMWLISTSKLFRRRNTLKKRGAGENLDCLKRIMGTIPTEVCYKRTDTDCTKIGMVNCFGKMCTRTSDNCIQTWIDRIINLAISIISVVGLVATAGASGGVTALVSSFKSSALNLMKEGLKATSKWLLTNVVTNAILQSCSATIDILKTLEANGGCHKTGKHKNKEYTVMVGTSNGRCCINTFVDDKGDGGFMRCKKEFETDEATVYKSLSIENFDFTGITAVKKDCTNLSSNDQKIRCTKAALSVGGLFDPTGITSLVGSFLHDQCVTNDGYIHNVQGVRVFKETDYVGKLQDITAKGPAKLTGKIKSLVIQDGITANINGKDTKGPLSIAVLEEDIKEITIK